MMWDVLIDRKGVNRIQTELLLRKAQSGDTGALDTLIAAYYPQILNYCRWHKIGRASCRERVCLYV